MKVEFVRVEYKNNKVTTATLEGHQEIIREYAEKGFHYAGYIPVLLGPSGKTLSIDLVFEKNQ